MSVDYQVNKMLKKALAGDIPTFTPERARAAMRIGDKTEREKEGRRECKQRYLAQVESLKKLKK